MTKKTLGYVKLVWTCPRCDTRNPGPNAFCNGCGAAQPEDVRFEQPAEAELIKGADELARAKAGPDIHCPYCGARNRGDVKFCGACGGGIAGGKARQAGRVVGAYRAPSGATRPCPSCGTPNPLTSLKCSSCGSALPPPAAEAKPVAPKPGRPSSMLFAGGAVALVCLAAVVFLGLSLRRTESLAEVKRVSWERTIAIEALGPVEHRDWEDEVPTEASGISCELAYFQTQPEPGPVATEVCGTPYTVDSGSGYGEVVQECEYQVYEPLCTYTIDEWAVVETLRSRGEDLNPAWPEVDLQSGQQEGAQEEAYTVVFTMEGDELSYSPESAAEFAGFTVGSEWTVVVNGLGAIVSVEPAP